MRGRVVSYSSNPLAWSRETVKLEHLQLTDSGDIVWVFTPGHGFYRIPADFGRRCASVFRGEWEPSAYSYQSGGFWYLEEDCDAYGLLALLGHVGAAVRYLDVDGGEVPADWDRLRVGGAL